MGSLYLARDPGLDRLVAIKLLKDDFQDDEDLRERFAREARSVARLRHPNIVIVFDVGADNRLSNRRRFADFMIDGVKCGPDGVRCDVDGNLWCASNAGRSVGYSGVTVWNPAGKLIGRIRLPEVCGNITFGGPKRNRLFMAASQSLYAVFVGTQGAGIA